MSARKWLAGGLIRLAHRIYRPKVTEIHTTVQAGEYIIKAHDVVAARKVAERRNRLDYLNMY